jgi:hypothetical protein
MRCDEVIRELAAPTDEQDPAALTEHITHCAACSAWAQRAIQLDRLWTATRPPEPPPEVWGNLWARLTNLPDLPASDELEETAPSVPSQNGSSAVRTFDGIPSDHLPTSWRRRWVVIALVGLAQAAAVILAVGLSWRAFGPPYPAGTTIIANSPSHSLPSHATVSALGTADALAAVSQDNGPQRFKIVSITVPSRGFPTVVEEGRLVVIHADSQPRKVLLPNFSSNSMFVIQAEGLLPRVVDMTPTALSAGVDGWYLGFGAVESLANPTVAMTE